jgi:amino acid transporter
MLPIFQKVFFASLAALAAAAVILYFIKKRNEKNLYNNFWNSLYNFCLTNFIIGIIIYFFNFESAPFLSARFWFLIWGAEMVVWLFFIIRLFLKIPERKERLEKDKEFKKYIP